METVQISDADAVASSLNIGLIMHFITDITSFAIVLNTKELVTIC